jgi:hypothetical protein
MKPSARRAISAIQAFACYPLVLPRDARFDVVPGRVTPRHHAVVVEPDRAP